MTLRPLITAFSLSLCLHASVGVSFRSFGEGEPDALSEAILVSPVSLEPEQPKPKPEILPAEPVLKKEAVMAPRPKRAKRVSKPAKAKSKAIKGASVSSAQGQGPPAAKPTTSAELLSDPKKGKIFIAYFAGVKERIYSTLKQNYNAQSGGAGEVALYFVLNAQGRLNHVAVIEKESDPEILLRNLAVDCLKSSAPFDAFPGDLKSEHIAFQVKIHFDEGM